MDKNLDYDSVTNALSQHGVNVDGAEVQGILCGMLSGGMAFSDQNWMAALSDTCNQGEPLPAASSALLSALYNQLCQQLVSEDYGLQLMLPDDNAPINDRGVALINWVQGFMLGFGLYQQDLMQCSEDVKEALNDFAEISRMAEPMDTDEESERAFDEVVEYVKISALLCFSELGQSLLEDQGEKPSIH